MKEKVTAIILSALRDLGEEIKLPALANPAPDLRLFGAKSPLDSMALVSLIADLEGRLAQEFGRELVLADERAMSQLSSPFRTVDSLANHIVERLREGAPS